MKVKELIAALAKENDEEEVVFADVGEEGNIIFEVIRKPLLHAGPMHFIDENGIPFTKSVVIVNLKKK